MMMNQLGQKPDANEIPVDLVDFPLLVQQAIEIFNRMNDRYTSTDLGPLYIGKDIASLPVLLDLYSVSDEQDRLLCLEIVQHLDAKVVKRARKKLEQAAKKLKNQANRGR